MSSFKIRLQDATHAEEFSGATTFVGEDASGSFGILPRHAPIMTSLVIGLARFRIGAEAWQYLAMPRAILYFRDNVLTLSTYRYLLDDDYMRISQALRQQLLDEQEKLAIMNQSLRRMEEEVLKRVWEASRTGSR